jgi:phosphohistidine swiveling domain-containing protein
MILSKTHTLEKLSHEIRHAKILPLVIFTVGEWKSGPDVVCRQILDTPWGKDSVIVRSSAVNEDTELESFAGKYDSVLDVKGYASLMQAVEQVIVSFGDTSSDNEVFVQPMLTDVRMSGVLFTVDPNTGGHYYVVNYDDKTGSTSSVTSGTGTELKIFYRFKGYEGTTVFQELDRVIDAAREIETLERKNALDIEFAVTADGIVYVLQVRPLIMKQAVKNFDTQKTILARAAEYLKQSQGPKPQILGDHPVYGIMPDWNPAEIVGIRPKPLALSLYKNLITDGTWAYQRDLYGYKDLRGMPLIIDFAGLPYIDARVSFNSFIPKTVDSELADKLVNYYVDRLIDHPEMHDKVEFEIIFSCYTFDLHERIKILQQYGFSKNECTSLASSLNSLTNRIIDVNSGLWTMDAKKIDVLMQRHKILMASDLSKVAKIYWLLEDCRRYGTLPFAGLARAGFIAVQLLKSLIASGIFSQAEYDAYIASLNTVSTNMARDFSRLNKNAFLEKYGHLRPGTYDICSPRYDEAADRYFNWDNAKNTVNYEHEFRLTIGQLEGIRTLLQKFGLSDDVLALFTFLKGAIEGREYSKFVFTRNLSDALVLLAQVGAEYGFSKDDLSFMDIEIWKSLYSSEKDVGEVIGQSIEQGKLRYQNTLGFTMPPVMTNPNDCYYFHIDDSFPNYITQKKVIGHVRFEHDVNLEGAVLMIPSADPGYDWVFSKNIAGFITKYGGANSHMAIRAGELSLPAIVGAGEKLFNRLTAAKVLEMDCALRKVEVIK